MLHSQLCMFTQVHVHVHVYSTVVVFNSPVSVASHASSRVVVVRRGCRSACGVHVRRGVAVHARSGRGTCGGGALTFATFVFCKALTHFARKLCTLHEPRQHVAQSPRICLVASVGPLSGSSAIFGASVGQSAQPNQRTCRLIPFSGARAQRSVACTWVVSGHIPTESLVRWIMKMIWCR